MLLTERRFGMIKVIQKQVVKLLPIATLVSYDAYMYAMAHKYRAIGEEPYMHGP